MTRSADVQSPKARPASRAAKLGLVVFGVVVALLGGELVARIPRDGYDARVRAFAEVAVVPDGRLSHRLRPGARVEVAGIAYRVSSLGTRGPELRTSPRFRVVALGDSVTMGWGVAESQAWPAQLARTLAARVQDSEVVNAAVLGWGVAQYVARFDELVPALAPNLVLVGYFPNDPAGTDGARAARAPGSELYRLLAARLGSGMSANAHARALHAPGSPGWRTVQRAFATLGARCQETHVACAIALLPSLTQLPYPLADEHRRLAALARSHGLHVVDLAPTLAARDVRTSWVAADDTHPNAAAQALYADAIFRSLAAHDLVPR